jgi:tryptophan synthase alpha chain
MRLSLLFEQIAAVRHEVTTPLILMGYFNQVMQFGEARFFRRCREAGIDGLILPDLPVYEYEAFYKDMIEAEGLGISFLITPQTSEARIRQIDALSYGFIYMVSSASITGARQGISQAQIDYFHRIQAMALKTPRLIGFGISNHETFRTACAYAHGAIIGSAYIKALAAGHDIQTTTHAFVQSIRNSQVPVPFSRV